jgi:hypothetical protein
MYSIQDLNRLEVDAYRIAAFRRTHKGPRVWKERPRYGASGANLALEVVYQAKFEHQKE